MLALHGIFPGGASRQGEFPWRVLCQQRGEIVDWCLLYLRGEIVNLGGEIQFLSVHTSGESCIVRGSCISGGGKLHSEGELHFRGSFELFHALCGLCWALPLSGGTNFAHAWLCWALPLSWGVVLESVRRAVALVLGADSFGFAIFKWSFQAFIRFWSLELALFVFYFFFGYLFVSPVPVWGVVLTMHSSRGRLRGSGGLLLGVMSDCQHVEWTNCV